MARSASLSDQWIIVGTHRGIGDGVRAVPIPQRLRHEPEHTWVGEFPLNAIAVFGTRQPLTRNAGEVVGMRR